MQHDNFDYIPLSDGSGKRIGEITLDAFADAVRLSVHFGDKGAFSLEVTPEIARRLAAGLYANADAAQTTPT